MQKSLKVFRSFFSVKKAENINLNIAILPIMSFEEEAKIQFWRRDRNANINVSLLERISIEKRKQIKIK